MPSAGSLFHKRAGVTTLWTQPIKAQCLSDLDQWEGPFCLSDSPSRRHSGHSEWGEHTETARGRERTPGTQTGRNRQSGGERRVISYSYSLTLFLPDTPELTGLLWGQRGPESLWPGRTPVWTSHTPRPGPQSHRLPGGGGGEVEPPTPPSCWGRRSRLRSELRSELRLLSNHQQFYRVPAMSGINNHNISRMTDKT